MKSVALQSIEMIQFKNHSSTKIQLPARLVCITGNNGMGKTNILDAIYTLCMCKSHISHRQSDIIQTDSDFVRLVGRFKIGEQPTHVVIKYPRRGAKKVAVNDLVYKKLKEHIGLLPVVMITPDDVKLLLGGSTERRSLIDNTICQIDGNYLDALAVYNHVLKQKSQLLKMEHLDIEVLKIYNQKLVEQASIIHTARHSFFEAFRPHVQSSYSAISEGKESIGIHYQSQLNDQQLAKLLEVNQQKEIIVKRCLYGIHKDEMELKLKDHPVKSYASQGQRKSLLLALRLAQVEILKGQLLKQPIILLDDLFDKLDEQRVRSLIKTLMMSDYGQIFITDTSQNRIEDAIHGLDIEPIWIKVQDGQIVS